MLYVSSEFADLGMAMRADQFWRLVSRRGSRWTFAGSRVRFVETKHPVVMPPKFETPQKRIFELRAPNRAEWNRRVDRVSQDPGSLDAWAKLLAGTGASLFGAKLRKLWSKLSVTWKVTRTPNDISVTRTRQGFEIRGKIAVRIPGSKSALNERPMRGHLRLQVEIDRANALASRGWFHLDMRASPMRFSIDDTLVPAERLAFTLAWCFDATGRASYAARCFSPHMPTLAPKHKHRDVAKSYVGRACAPRVAALKKMMKLFPHETWVQTPPYPLVASTHGGPVRLEGFELDIHNDQLASVGSKRTVADLVAKERSKYDKASIVFQLRVPAQGRVAGAISQLVKLTAPNDEIALIVEDPRPRNVSFAPKNAAPWVHKIVAQAVKSHKLTSDYAHRLSKAVGLCAPLIKMFGDAISLPLSKRAAFVDRILPKAILDCRCEGVDVDGIDAFRRLWAVAQPRHRYHEIALPLTADPSAPAIAFAKHVSGKVFVDRVGRLSPAERKGFRLVFH